LDWLAVSRSHRETGCCSPASKASSGQAAPVDALEDYFVSFYFEYQGLANETDFSGVD
jgi:hypothetical protein